jgi:monoamine oxidase
MTRPVSPALRAVSSQWNTDPDFGGAYSFLRAGGVPEDRDALAREILPGLWLAGEYTWRDSPGTLHGAIFSGERAARHVLSGNHAGDVIVIGAGLAGMAAARALGAADWPVRVLEAGSRHGGRAMSTQALGGDLPLGGAWLHGVDGHPLAPLVRARPWTFDGIDAYWQNAGAVDQDEQAHARNRLDAIEADLDALVVHGADCDLAAGLRAIGVADEAAVAQPLVDMWLRLRYENLMAAPRNELSVRHRSEPYHLPGGDHQIVAGLEQALAHYADGLDIRTGQRVRGLRRVGDLWRVSTEDGAAFDARHVICATPVTALRDGNIRVDPPLPEDVRARLAHIGFGPVTKTFCVFARAFWSPRVRFAITGSPPPPFEFFVDVSALAGCPALCAFSVGVHAIAVERMPERDKCTAIDRLLASLIYAS